MPTEKRTVIETLLETFEQIESLLIKEKNESAINMPYAQKAQCYWKWRKRINQMLEKMRLHIMSSKGFVSCNGTLAEIHTPWFHHLNYLKKSSGRLSDLKQFIAFYKTSSPKRPSSGLLNIG